MVIQIDDAGALIENLRALPSETDWLEFKVATYQSETIGKYVSALANAAMFHERDHAYMVFGIADDTHEVVGTDVRLDLKKVGNDNFLFWLANLLDPKITVQHQRVWHRGKHVEILCIDPGFQRPVTFKGFPYIRVDSAQQPLSKYPNIQQKIWAIASRYAFETTTLETNATKQRVLSGFMYEKLLSLMKRRWDGGKEVLEALGSYGFVESNLQDRFHIKALLPLLAAKDVNEFPLLRYKSARVISYKGTDKLTSVDDREGVRGYAVAFDGILQYIMDRVPHN